MKPYVPVTMTAGTLRSMTAEQLQALIDNVLAEGRWDNVTDAVRIDGGEYLGVYLPGIFLGIEKDGYCHS